MSNKQSQCIEPSSLYHNEGSCGHSKECIPLENQPFEDVSFDTFEEPSTLFQEGSSDEMEKKYTELLQRMLQTEQFSSSSYEGQMLEEHTVDLSNMLDALKNVLSDANLTWQCPYSDTSPVAESTICNGTFCYLSLVQHLLDCHQCTFGIVTHMAPFEVRHRRDKYGCASCSYKTSHPVTFLEHLRHHANSGYPYMCLHCKRGLSALTFTEHRKICQPSDTPNIKLQNSLEVASTIFAYRYICPVCPGKARFLDSSSYVEHLFGHEDFSVVHDVENRRSGIQYLKIDNKYECQSCRLSTAYMDIFIEHIRCHLADAPYRCKVCIRSFRTPKEYHIHLNGCAKAIMDIDERSRQIKKILRNMDNLTQENVVDTAQSQPSSESPVQNLIGDKKTKQGEESPTVECSEGKKKRNAVKRKSSDQLSINLQSSSKFKKILPRPESNQLSDLVLDDTGKCECYMCSKHTFSSICFPEFLKHVAQHHIDFTQVKTDLSGASCAIKYQDNSYHCEGCSFSTSIRLAFQEHMRMHVVSLPYRCKKCGKYVLSVLSPHCDQCGVEALELKDDPDLDKIMSRLGPQAPAVSHEVIDRGDQNIRESSLSSSSLLNDDAEGLYISHGLFRPRDPSSTNTTIKSVTPAPAATTTPKAIEPAKQQPTSNLMQQSPTQDKINRMQQPTPILIQHPVQEKRKRRQQPTQNVIQQSPAPEKGKRLRKSNAQKETKTEQESKRKASATPQKRQRKPRAKPSIPGNSNEKKKNEDIIGIEDELVESEIVLTEPGYSGSEVKPDVLLNSTKDQIINSLLRFLLENYDKPPDMISDAVSHRQCFSLLAKLNATLAKVKVQCPTCDDFSATYPSFISHMITCCKLGQIICSSSVDWPLLEYQTLSYKCVPCQALLSKPIEVFEHLRHHVSITSPYRCLQCKCFITAGKIGSHRRKCPDKQVMAVLEVPLIRYLVAHAYWCITCRQGLLTRAEYVCHLAMHSICCVLRPAANVGKNILSFVAKLGESSFTCRACDFFTCHEQAFLEHVRCHLSETPYSCNMCFESFSNAFSFQRHCKGVMRCKKAEMYVDSNVEEELKNILDHVCECNLINYGSKGKVDAYGRPRRNRTPHDGSEEASMVGEITPNSFRLAAFTESLKGRCAHTVNLPEVPNSLTLPLAYTYEKSRKESQDEVEEVEETDTRVQTVPLTRYMKQILTQHVRPASLTADKDSPLASLARHVRTNSQGTRDRTSSNTILVSIGETGTTQNDYSNDYATESRLDPVTGNLESDTENGPTLNEAFGIRNDTSGEPCQLEGNPVASEGEQVQARTKGNEKSIVGPDNASLICDDSRKTHRKQNDTNALLEDNISSESVTFEIDELSEVHCHKQSSMQVVADNLTEPCKMAPGSQGNKDDLVDPGKVTGKVDMENLSKDKNKEDMTGPSTNATTDDMKDLSKETNKDDMVGPITDYVVDPSKDMSLENIAGPSKDTNSENLTGPSKDNTQKDMASHIKDKNKDMAGEEDIEAPRKSTSNEAVNSPENETDNPLTSPSVSAGGSKNMFGDDDFRSHVFYEPDPWADFENLEAERLRRALFFTGVIRWLLPHSSNSSNRTLRRILGSQRQVQDRSGDEGIMQSVLEWMLDVPLLGLSCPLRHKDAPPLIHTWRQMLHHVLVNHQWGNCIKEATQLQIERFDNSFLKCTSCSFLAIHTCLMVEHIRYHAMLPGQAPYACRACNVPLTAATVPTHAKSCARFTKEWDNLEVHSTPRFARLMLTYRFVATTNVPVNVSGLLTLGQYLDSIVQGGVKLKISTSVEGFRLANEHFVCYVCTNGSGTVNQHTVHSLDTFLEHVRGHLNQRPYYCMICMKHVHNSHFGVGGCPLSAWRLGGRHEALLRFLHAELSESPLIQCDWGDNSFQLESHCRPHRYRAKTFFDNLGHLFSCHNNNLSNRRFIQAPGELTFSGQKLLYIMCHVCDLQTFESVVWWREHMRSHFLKKPYMCVSCVQPIPIFRCDSCSFGGYPVVRESRNVNIFTSVLRSVNADKFKVILPIQPEKDALEVVEICDDDSTKESGPGRVAAERNVSFYIGNHPLVNAHQSPETLTPAIRNLAVATPFTRQTENISLGCSNSIILNLQTHIKQNTPSAANKRIVILPNTGHSLLSNYRSPSSTSNANSKSVISLPFTGCTTVPRTNTVPAVSLLKHAPTASAGSTASLIRPPNTILRPLPVLSSTQLHTSSASVTNTVNSLSASATNSSPHIVVLTNPICVWTPASTQSSLEPATHNSGCSISHAFVDRSTASSVNATDGVGGCVVDNNFVILCDSDDSNDSGIIDSPGGTSLEVTSGESVQQNATITYTSSAMECTNSTAITSEPSRTPYACENDLIEPQDSTQNQSTETTNISYTCQNDQTESQSNSAQINTEPTSTSDSCQNEPVEENREKQTTEQDIGDRSSERDIELNSPIKWAETHDSVNNSEERNTEQEEHMDMSSERNGEQSSPSKERESEDILENDVIIIEPEVDLPTTHNLDASHVQTGESPASSSSSKRPENTAENSTHTITRRSSSAVVDLDPQIIDVENDSDWNNDGDSSANPLPLRVVQIDRVAGARNQVGVDQYNKTHQGVVGVWSRSLRSRKMTLAGSISFNNKEYLTKEVQFSYNLFDGYCCVECGFSTFDVIRFRSHIYFDLHVRFRLHKESNCPFCDRESSANDKRVPCMFIKKIMIFMQTLRQKKETVKPFIKFINGKVLCGKCKLLLDDPYVAEWHLLTKRCEVTWKNSFDALTKTRPRAFILPKPSATERSNSVLLGHLLQNCTTTSTQQGVVVSVPEVIDSRLLVGPQQQRLVSLVSGQELLAAWTPSSIGSSQSETTSVLSSGDLHAQQQASLASQLYALFPYLTPSTNSEVTTTGQTTAEYIGAGAIPLEQHFQPIWSMVEVPHAACTQTSSSVSQQPIMHTLPLNVMQSDEANSTASRLELSPIDLEMRLIASDANISLPLPSPESHAPSSVTDNLLPSEVNSTNETNPTPATNMAPSEGKQRRKFLVVDLLSDTEPDIIVDPNESTVRVKMEPLDPSEILVRVLHDHTYTVAEGNPLPAYYYDEENEKFFLISRGKRQVNDGHAIPISRQQNCVVAAPDDMSCIPHSGQLVSPTDVSEASTSTKEWRNATSANPNSKKSLSPMYFVSLSEHGYNCNHCRLSVSHLNEFKDHMFSHIHPDGQCRDSQSSSQQFACRRMRELVVKLSQLVNNPNIKKIQISWCFDQRKQLNKKRLSGPSAEVCSEEPQTVGDESALIPEEKESSSVRYHRNVKLGVKVLQESGYKNRFTEGSPMAISIVDNLLALSIADAIILPNDSMATKLPLCRPRNVALQPESLRQNIRIWKVTEKIQSSNNRLHADELQDWFMYACERAQLTTQNKTICHIESDDEQPTTSVMPDTLEIPDSPEVDHIPSPMDSDNSQYIMPQKRNQSGRFKRKHTSEEDRDCNWKRRNAKPKTNIKNEKTGNTRKNPPLIGYKKGSSKDKHVNKKPTRNTSWKNVAALHTQCSWCDFQAWSKAQLESHEFWHGIADSAQSNSPALLASISKVDSFQCPVCPCRTESLTDFKFHAQFHKEPPKLRYCKCAKCPYVTTSEDRMEKHCHDDHSDHDAWEDESSYLVKTVKVQFHEGSYNCPYESCSRLFRHIIVLQEHCVHQHDSPLQDKHRLDFYNPADFLPVTAPRTSMVDSDSLECDFCSFETEDLELLLQHLYNMHGVDKDSAAVAAHRLRQVSPVKQAETTSRHPEPLPVNSEASRLLNNELHQNESEDFCAPESVDDDYFDVSALSDAGEGSIPEKDQGTVVAEKKTNDKLKKGNKNKQKKGKSSISLAKERERRASVDYKGSTGTSKEGHRSRHKQASRELRLLLDDAVQKRVCNQRSIVERSRLRSLRTKTPGVLNTNQATKKSSPSNINKQAGRSTKTSQKDPVNIETSIDKDKSTKQKDDSGNRKLFSELKETDAQDKVLETDGHKTQESTTKTKTPGILKTNQAAKNSSPRPSNVAKQAGKSTKSLQKDPVNTETSKVKSKPTKQKDGCQNRKLVSELKETFTEDNVFETDAHKTQESTTKTMLPEQNTDISLPAVSDHIQLETVDTPSTQIMHRANKVNSLNKRKEKGFVYYCTLDDCNYKTVETRAVQPHVNNHLNYKPYQCTRCSKRYHRVDHAKRHCKSDHVGVKVSFFENRIPETEQKVADIMSDIFRQSLYGDDKVYADDIRCTFCLRPIKGMDGWKLRMHICKHLAFTPLRCLLCRFSCVSTSGIAIHLRAIHGRHDATEFVRDEEQEKILMREVMLIKSESNRRMQNIGNVLRSQTDVSDSCNELPPREPTSSGSSVPVNVTDCMKPVECIIKPCPDEDTSSTQDAYDGQNEQIVFDIPGDIVIKTEPDIIVENDHMEAAYEDESIVNESEYATDNSVAARKRAVIRTLWSPLGHIRRKASLQEKDPSSPTDLALSRVLCGYRCGRCGVRRRRYADIKAHRWRCVDNDRYHCSACQFKTKVCVELLKHYQNAHPGTRGLGKKAERKSELPRKIYTIYAYRCAADSGHPLQYHKKMSLSQVQLQRRRDLGLFCLRRKASPSKPQHVFICVRCRQRFPTRTCLERHLRMLELRFPRFGCAHCTTQAHYKGQILAHCSSQHPELEGSAVPVVDEKKARLLADMLKRGVRPLTKKAKESSACRLSKVVAERETPVRLEPEIVADTNQSYFEDFIFERTPVQIPRADPLTGLRQCAFCRYKCACAASTSAHVLLHAPPHWRCDRCGQNFILLKRLEKHCQMAHRSCVSYTNLVTGEICVQGEITQSAQLPNLPHLALPSGSDKSKPTATQVASNKNNKPAHKTVKDNKKVTVSKKGEKKLDSKLAVSKSAESTSNIKSKSGSSPKSGSDKATTPGTTHCEGTKQGNIHKSTAKQSPGNVVEKAGPKCSKRSSSKTSGPGAEVHSGAKPAKKGIELANVREKYVVDGRMSPRVRLVNFMQLSIEQLFELLTEHKLSNINY